MFTIVTLTEDWALAHVDELRRIEAVCAAASAGRYRNAWSRENYLEPLPGKWTYSRVVLAGTAPVGFYIASQKVTSDGEGVLHGHNVAILPEARTPNLLRAIYDDMFAEARRNGLRWFAGYQAEFNPLMMQWYVRMLRCRVVTVREDAERFIGPVPATVTFEPDGRMHSADGFGQYLIVKPLD